MDLVQIAMIAAPTALLLVVGTALIARMRRIVPENKALILHRSGRTEVSFNDKLVSPLIQRAELIDIGLQRLDITCRGREGVICRDNLRADIEVSFLLKINRTPEDVLKVVQALGAQRAGRPEVIEEIFGPKFTEALKTVFRQFDLEDAINEREHLRDQLLMIIGDDLNGFRLEDAAVAHIEQTPIEHLDPQNILDAEGIRKITERTAELARRKHEIELEQAEQLARLDMESNLKLVEIRRIEAEARRATHKEIAKIQNREEAEAAAMTLEEDARLERARSEVRPDLALPEISIGLGLPDIALED